MKISAVTVCVNYSDFLVHCIEANKKQIDRWIIVTDTKDYKTKALCDFHDLECVQTDVFYEHGGIFNKYAGLNQGLSMIHKDSWVLFLDGDIALHPEMKRVLSLLKLQEDCIYGVDRINISGIVAWEKYKAGKGMLQENWLLHTGGYELGSRLVHHYGHHGESGRAEFWRPLGFFQLAHKNYFEEYPQNSKGADHCDLIFARQWPRHRRHLIPELFVVHLESPRGEHYHKGVNWYGRKSLPFDIEIHEEQIKIKEDLKNHTIEIDIKEIDIEIKGCPPNPTY